MKGREHPGRESGIYYRLVALWVLAEAMLGGIIHGFKIPVSGLVVGSCAVACICLIAWYVPARGAILKATIIVAVFKMMLSPQAPSTAYIAVFFQGLLGELLFWRRRFFRVACMALAILALLESGFQRILMLTIIYGNDFWKAINDFINGLIPQRSAINYSVLIGGAYVLIHLLGGIFTGWIVSGLPQRVEKWKKQKENGLMMVTTAALDLPGRSRRRKGLKKGVLVIWLLLIALYVQSYYRLGEPLLPPHISLRILLRSLIIVLAWILIISPLLNNLLRYWLKRAESQTQGEIQQVLQLLPVTKQLVAASWRKTTARKGWRRVVSFIKLMLVNLLSPVTEAGLFILTAPMQSGKTTSLLRWSEKRKDVFGILSPVVHGKRMFMDAHLRQLFDMEARDGQGEPLSVGKFLFSRDAFRKAIAIIHDSLSKSGWLIIDEVGPMELRGEGFHAIVREAIARSNPQQKLILVVREGLIDNVRDHFGLHHAVVIQEVIVH